MASETNSEIESEPSKTGADSASVDIQTPCITDSETSPLSAVESSGTTVVENSTTVVEDSTTIVENSTTAVENSAATVVENSAATAVENSAATVVENSASSPGVNNSVPSTTENLASSGDNKNMSSHSSELLANMPIDAAIDAAFGAPSTQTDLIEQAEGGLRPCPDCDTLVEPWQVTCHNCGRHNADNLNLSSDNAADDDIDIRDLEQSYKDWLEKGVLALSNERFGEAQTCFLEALARTRALPDRLIREIETRKELARALEKLDKKREATEQYMLLASLNQEVRAENSDEFTKRARQLSLSTMDILSAVDKNATFRPPVGSEFRLAPLYCGECKRILLESEVYYVRKGRDKRVRCFCGADGVPLVRSDAKHLRALKTASVVRKRKTLLIQAASDHIAGGRKKQTAVILAVVLGGLGIHKFYLGERLPGFLYLLFCWTLIPSVVAWFEAINYSQMSRVTFNLMYNIEYVILRLPPETEDETSSDHTDIFSMAITEPEPEDFVDQFSTTELQK